MHCNISMLVFICVVIDKQNSYMHTVCLVRLLKLDTLPLFFYYELLLVSGNKQNKFFILLVG